MTREAKIGLLVALAFILVIGILLSDHVTSATREPAAPLTSIEGSIRGSTTTPGTAPQLQNPPRLPGQTQEPATSTYVFPANVEQGGDVVASLGTPQNPVQPPLDDMGTGDPWRSEQPAAPTNVASEAQTPTQAPAGATGAPAQPLQELVREHGQDLEALAQPKGGTNSQMAGVKEYTIASGDSLSKIVAKHLGRYTPANEALLLSLNPKLKANKDRIIVGEKVFVPATASAVENLRAASASTAANSQQQRAPSAVEQPQPKAASAARSSGARTYVVKDGDTLWSIASKQLGSGARHEELLKLNADKLSGPDELQVGMKLKLPGSEQRVASAD